MRITRTISIVLLGLSAIAVHAAPPARPSSRWRLTYQPRRIVNGAPVLFRVTAPGTAAALSAKWLDHEISFTFDARQKAWFGLAGISLETRPGIYAIELRAEMKRGPA